MKVKIQILSILLFAGGICSFTSAYAQTSVRTPEAKKLFVNMPDSLTPLLTAVNKADCIDFLESKMKAQVDNRFGSKSEMTELSKDYVRMQMTPQSTWQMKSLALNDSTHVVCIINTACAPACDSRVSFYTTDWKPLSASRFVTLPVMDDFMLSPDSAAIYTFDEARRSADMLLMKADLNKDHTELTVTLSTPDYMSKETAEKLMPFLRRSIVYQWKDGVFVK